MSMRLLITLLVLHATCKAVEAAPIQLITTESGFTPGVPLMFTMELPSITGLGAYNIDVLLSGSSGTVGVDYFFDSVATTVAASGYVFPEKDSYFQALNTEPMGIQRLTLTDFVVSGVDLVPGINSRIANLVVGTSPTFTGMLTLTIDADSLILDTANVIPTSVLEFESIRAATLSAGPSNVTAVPEPRAMLMVAFACLACVIGMTRRTLASRADLCHH